MKTVEFENLINMKTNEPVKVEVPDDFNPDSMEHWGELGRQSGERMRKALASPRVEMPPNFSREEKRQLILDSFSEKMTMNQKDLDDEFARDIDEHFWDLF